MKLLNIFFIILIFLICSCSFFEDRDELLTEKEWMLYSRITNSSIDNEKKSEWQFFKKSEEALTFKFTKYGDLIVKENKGNKFATVKWNWANEDKEKFIMNTGRSSTEFNILKLNKNELAIYRITYKENSTYGGSVAETFKLAKDETWTDEIIESLKKVSMNH